MLDTMYYHEKNMEFKQKELEKKMKDYWKDVDNNQDKESRFTKFKSELKAKLVRQEAVCVSCS